MAVELEQKFHGQIPDDFNLLVSLPGISHCVCLLEFQLSTAHYGYKYHTIIDFCREIIDS